MKNLSIILCTYNEVITIKKTISEIILNFPESEIIVVDDNSNDGTQQVIKEINSNNLRLINRNQRGLAAACMVGLIFAKNSIVTWIDSNQPNLVKEIYNMVDELGGNDIVVMSRYVKGGKDLRSPQRVLSSRLINFICQKFLDSSIKDYTSGIFTMKKDVLIDVLPICYGHGEYFIEFLYQSKKKGLRIKELPFIQPPDIEFLSKTASSLTRFLKLGLFYIFRIFISKFNRH